ncbi:MAG: MATE family efflux transporter [Clostridia bacterium]|nr:MATE family efflux transporter [Clostridia bacterium]
MSGKEALFLTRDMTKGRPLGLIVSFALPLLAGMLFQQLYNFVDAMIVGRFLGVNALAGVGATGSINFLVLGFCMGVCAGFSIPLAQRFGAGELSRMREFAANAIYLSAAFALVMTTATVVFCRDILTAMDTPQDCMQEAYAYISVIFAGIPFAFLYNLTSGFLRALGDSKTPLFFLVLSSVMNVALDLLFILGLDMGISGASLATVISQAASGLLCLGWIALKVPALHIAGGEWRARGVRMTELCACGLPMGLQYSITAIGSVILQTAVNGLGAHCVAAVTATGKVFGFLACPFDALGSTMATYTAQNAGAGKYDRLNRGVFSASLMGFVYSLGALVFAVCLGDDAVMLFVSGAETEIITLAHRYMMVSAVFCPFLTLVNVVRFAIQGMGFSALAILAGVLEMAARMLAGLLLVPALGFTGAMLGSPLAWVLADLFLVPAYFRCRRVLMTRVHHRYDPA